jgi:hypothetical protein
MYGFTKEEEKFLRTLNTPGKVQDYLDSLPFNFEEEEESCMSPRCVLRAQKAHCMEGALLASAVFFLQGRKPLLLNLKVGNRKDQDHIVALFQENGFWGAVSKTNHAVLRFRDPVYRTVRELAMSYFHEYFLTKDGTKTLKGYLGPINMRRFGTKWLTDEEGLWKIAEIIFDSKHVEIVPASNKRHLKKASSLERKAASIPAS